MRRTLEPWLAFAVVTVVAAVLYRVPALSSYFRAIVAALFLYVPAALAWREGRELEDYGLRARPVSEGLLLVAILMLLVFPAFFVGFGVFQRVACAVPSLRPLAPGPCLVAPVGVATTWLSRFHLRAPLHPLALAAGELVVVALPEETFFRGFLQARLEERWPASRRILGAPVGRALVVQAGLFALCHVAVQGNLAVAAVFFPGLLFGWLRARTGSLLAGTLFHALCNLYIETLNRSFFG